MGFHKTFTRYKEIIVLLVLVIIYFWKIIINNTQMINSPSSDVITAHSFWKWLYASTITHYGELPLWNPYVFSGTPFVGNPLPGIFYPINILYVIFPTNLVFGYILMLNVFLMGLFTYIYARTINLSKYSALVSAITFMFSGIMTTRIYTDIIDYFVWFPLVLLFYELTVRKKKFTFGILAGFPLALLFFTHTQFAGYVLFASVLYFIFRSFEEIRHNRDTGCLVNLMLILSVSMVVFFSLSAVQLLPMVEFSKLTNRAEGLSYEEVTSYSLTPQFLIAFIIPEFFGSPVNNTYFHSGSLWELCGYVGVLPLLLAIIGSIFITNKYRSIFLGFAIFSLLFALGKYTPVFSVFYYYIPGFDQFRVPPRFLLVYTFSVAILAGFGSSFLIEAIRENQRQRFNKFIKALSFISILAIILLILAYLAKPYIISFGQSIITERYSSSRILVTHPLSYWYEFAYVIYSTILKSIIVFVIFLVSSAWIISLNGRGKIKLSYFQLLMILLIVSDLFAFGWKFIDTKDPDEVFKPPEFVGLIKNDSTRYRVLDLTELLGQEKAGKAGIELINGYDPSYLRLYQDFLWLSGSSSIPGAPKYNMYINIPDTYNLNILRLLNTKYIIATRELNLSGLDIIYNKNNVSIYEVKNTMPRAFIIRNARVIEDKKEIFAVLQNKEFDIKEEIVLEKDPNVPIYNAGEFEDAEISKYTPNRIEIELNMTNPGFLVLSEIWYPGWKAYDNGQEIEVYKTDYALRSVYVKSGKHSIRFEYTPDSYRIGKMISIVSLVICILIFIIIYRSEKHRYSI